MSYAKFYLLFLIVKDGRNESVSDSDYLGNSTFCCPSPLFPSQESHLCNKENLENLRKGSSMTDSRRNNWLLYGRQHEPVGLFLLVPAVHKGHTVYYSFKFES